MPMSARSAAGSPSFARKAEIDAEGPASWPATTAPRCASTAHDARNDDGFLLQRRKIAHSFVRSSIGAIDFERCAAACQHAGKQCPRFGLSLRLRMDVVEKNHTIAGRIQNAKNFHRLSPVTWAEAQGGSHAAAQEAMRPAPWVGSTPMRRSARRGPDGVTD